MIRARASVIAMVVALVAITAPARALAIGPPRAPQDPADQPNPQIYEGMEVVDRRGTQVPLDLRFRDHLGQPVTLADYVRGDVPVVLVMAYYTCPGLCTAVINDMMNRVKVLDFVPGQDFRVVVVSFDPRDTTELARGKQANYAATYGKPLPPRSLDFLTLADDKEAGAKLAEAIGFQYKWDDLGKLYGHPGVIFVLAPGGKLSVSIPTMNEARDLRLALVQAGEGQVGSFFDQVFARCYHWDPDSHGYKLLAFQLFKWAGLLVIALLGVLFLFMWRIERRRRRNTPSTGEPHAVRT
jgi:protein SCO1/2